MNPEDANKPSQPDTFAERSQFHSSAGLGDREAARLSKIAEGRELLQHALARDARLLAGALEAEKAGEAETVWLAMAGRAENNRFITRLRRDLEALESEPRLSPNENKMSYRRRLA